MNIITPPQRVYITPEVDSFHLTVEQHFAATGTLPTMDGNEVYDESFDD